MSFNPSVYLSLATSSERSIGLAAVEEEVHDEQPTASVEEESDSESDASSSEDVANLEAFHNLDRDQIADNLANLYFDAKNLLAMFQSQRQGQAGHIVDELNDASSKTSIKLRKLSARLQETRLESFGRNEIISYDHIVRKVAGLDLSSAEVPLGDWRPDGVVYLANLATALSICLGTKQEQRRITSFLMLLRESFPASLAPGYVTETSQPFETAILGDTQRLTVDLRTQLSIIVLKTQAGKSDFDMNGMLQSLWSTDDETLKPLAEERLAAIRAGMREDSDEGLNFDQLETDYSWDEFLTHFLTWAQKRATELESQIQAQGGIEKVQERVGQGVEEMLAEPPYVKARSALSEMSLGAMDQRDMAKASLQAPFEGHPATGRPSMNNWLTSLKGQAASRNSNVGSTTLLDTSGSLPASAQINVSASSSAELPSTQYSIDTLEAVQRQDAERNKENMMYPAPRVPQSFNAPQAGAVHVTWDDTQAEAGPSARKRAHAEVDDDEDEFEADQRQHKAPQRKKRAKPPPQQHPQSPAHSVFSATQADRDAQFSSPNSAMRPPPRPIKPSPARRLASSSAPTVRQTDPHIDPRIIGSQVSADTNPDDDLSTGSQNGLPSTQEVNRRAKAFTRVQRLHINATQQTVPQKRTPWSQHETERLIELVEAHGTGWAAILKIDENHPEGALLQRRGQVGLKDKARNMKMDFLK